MSAHVPGERARPGVGAQAGMAGDPDRIREDALDA
jgi:hypothetical protein